LGPFGWVSSGGVGGFVPYREKLTNITPGASPTMLMSELRLPRAGNHPDVRGAAFNDPGVPRVMAAPTPHPALRHPSNACPANASDPQYDTTMPCLKLGDNYGSARSRHTGGVNVVMCDGSVSFVRNSISLATWQALASINGGEVLGGDY